MLRIEEINGDLSKEFEMLVSKHNITNTNLIDIKYATNTQSSALVIWEDFNNKQAGV